MFISAPSFLVLSPISRQAKLISRNETAELVVYLARVQLSTPLVRESPRFFADIDEDVSFSFLLQEHSFKFVELRILYHRDILELFENRCG